MAQFKYTLPSGKRFTMTAPAGTTQAQANQIFYSQVAAGSLVGFTAGQSISGAKSSVTKFALSRLDRDRKSTRLNSSHIPLSRMPSSA